MASIMRTSIKLKHILTIIYSSVYIASSGAETLAVKALNYANIPLYLPGYTAFLSNAMWLLMIPVYFSSLRKRNSNEDELLKLSKIDQTTRQYALQYFMMGILTFAITLLRNLSLNLLPGSIFSLLISTSIAFNMFLNFFFLKKSFNSWHLLAAVLCVGTAISASSSGFISQQDGSIINEVGVIEALVASFFIAVMSVYQEHLQTLWADKDFRIIEMSLISSFIASLLILLYSWLSGEVRDWKPSLELSTSTREGLILVSCISVALPILKMFVRNSKYSTIQYSSSFFFEFVQATSALSTSLGSIFIFKETWSASYLGSLFCMSLSFAAYIQAKRIASTSAKGLLQKTSTLIIKNTEIDEDPEVSSTHNPLSPKSSKDPQHDVVEFR